MVCSTRKYEVYICRLEGFLQIYDENSGHIDDNVKAITDRHGIMIAFDDVVVLMLFISMLWDTWYSNDAADLADTADYEDMKGSNGIL